MPAKRKNVSSNVEKFELVLIKALAQQTRRWAKVEWPPALEEFVVTDEHVAWHNEKPDLSRQGDAREALDPVCDVLAELIRGASTESEIQLWVTMWCFYGNSMRHAISVAKNDDVCRAIRDEDTTVEALVRDTQLPTNRVNSFREAIRRMASGLTDEMLTASKNTGLTRWYAAICARVAARQRFGSLPAALPDDIYIDRPNEMAQLDRLMENGGGGLASLEGAPGVGKSTLARAWAKKHQFQGTFPLGICWIKAGHFDDRAFWLHIHLGVPDDDAFRSWLRQRHRLLILHGVQDEQTIEWITKLGDIAATVLITTDSSAWLEGRCAWQRRILLRGMTPNEGRALLAAHLPHSGENPEYPIAMDQIGELLAWRPKYLELVASLAGSTSPADALALLRERSNRPLHPRESPECVKGFWTLMAEV